MQKNYELEITDKNFSNLSEQELIEEIKKTKRETIKYVNKFLEVEEKWAFTNILLKELNSIRNKGELCQSISNGFLKLTNSKFCLCCLFNYDNNAIEFNKVAQKGNVNKIELEKYLKEVNQNCLNFIKKQSEINIIHDYFISICGNRRIITPIVYSQTFLGYLLLIKDDDNFYNENINFINIFPEHIALILENISLYQESEKQNKRKIEFLAGISHEFKTPLNAIIGFTEIIQSRNKDSKIFNYINNILQSSKHLLSLIEDIIDISKTECNSLKLNYSYFCPKDEILQIISTLEEMIKEKNIKLNYTLSDIKISADVKRFRQLIFNLLSNAIKFNKENGKIIIFTYIKDNKFFFEITDTGDGISKKNHDKIFNFFSQVNRSMLKRQLGSGIGLAMCKLIIQNHKGEINFKSQIKKGSTFWFSLPL